jgi:hypothetical protein
MSLSASSRSGLFEKFVDDAYAEGYADVNLRNIRLVPTAIITPDGEAHHLGGAPGADRYTHADFAKLEDLLTDRPGCIAVPFSCHC